MFIAALSLLLVTILGINNTAFALDFPGPAPGQAESKIEDQRFILENNIIAMEWGISEGKFHPIRVTNRITDQSIQLNEMELFRLFLKNNLLIAASDMKLITKPSLEELKSLPDAATLTQQYPGQELKVGFATEDGAIEIKWRAILRDQSNAIRQEFILLNHGEELPLEKITFLELPSQETLMAGDVPGSPIINKEIFFACEHPNATNIIGKEKAECSLECNILMAPRQSIVNTAAIGSVPPDQHRRGFLYYIERERAHPYRPFLHYNSWYDICWADLKINEEQCIKVIELYGTQFTQKWDIPLASFVWDDGWDDPKTLWRSMKKNFPDGFSKILHTARKYDSTLGFWLSPFGGYGKPAEDRYAFGKMQGFEMKQGKFALAGEKYYQRFAETCREMIQKNGSNFFKFDGLTKDITETEAMLRLSRELRGIDPDLFISITTGTWPSPYWLWYGDSTWRGANDMGFHGPGSKREQWMTYRDMITYRNVVQPAPLYPLNSIMNQGIAHAHYGTASQMGNSPEEMKKEFRSFFACGTCLQELYISPDMMTAENWKDLAEAAKWSQKNADVLVDVHWIGGDPGLGEIYGWASWSKRKGVIALRNPNPSVSEIKIDIKKAFELPTKAARKYRLTSPWKEDSAKPVITLQAGSTYSFTLQPFEILVYDAEPLLDI